MISTQSIGLALLALTTSSLAAPGAVRSVEERHIIEVEKRQDVNQLIQLASLAGITALPTDPAVLLSLGPLANSLAGVLPTSSVLAVLVTAAPSGFVSSIVNDPSFASSFESDFSAGSSPSWFNALPTDVKSYLHTYTGFGGLAGAAAGIQGAETGAAGNGTGSANATAMSSGSSMMTTGSSSMSSMSSSSSASSMSQSKSSSSGGSAAGGATSSSSHAGAAQPTKAVAAGVMGILGLLGVAVAL